MNPLIQKLRQYITGSIENGQSVAIVEKPLQWDSYDYRIAEHYLSALINGDMSGMDDAEIEEFDTWHDAALQNARAAGFTIGHWSDVDGSGEDWGRCDVTGLFAMRCTVRLMVYRREGVDQ